MITVKVTSERTLSSPEEIAAHLKTRYEAMTSASKFAPGEAVKVTARAGMVPDLAVGDVAVVVASVPGAPFTHVLALHATGSEMVVQVMTENLGKAEQAS